MVMAQQVSFNNYTVYVDFDFANNIDLSVEVFNVWALDKIHATELVYNYYLYSGNYNLNKYYFDNKYVDIKIHKNTFKTFIANLFNRNPNKPTCVKIQ